MNIEVNQQQIPALLFSMRKQRKYTRKEVSTLCKITPITIYNIEKGRHKPAIDTLQKLFDVYKYAVKFQISDLIQKSIDQDFEKQEKSIELNQKIPINNTETTTENTSNTAV